MKMNNNTEAKCRVLIADDDEKVCSLLGELLETEGYKVVRVGDGDSAWREVQQFLPDVVVSDVVMPFKSGIELCRLIKQEQSTWEIPVLLISGQRNGSEDSIEGLK